jgi:sulfoxide reductase heme-binding subunit YedZ
VSAVAPAHQLFWFASRAFGIVALVGLALSVALGLAMSGRLTRQPGRPAQIRHFHESLTLVTLGLIAVHGGLLLFDSYLRPGLAGITLPFALGYRPLFTGMGIIAGWLAAILGLGFYLRKRIGVKTWRFMHRFTVVAYLLTLGHVLGSGTDAGSPWMIALLTALTAPIIFAFTYRILPSEPPPRPAASRQGDGPSGQNRATSPTASPQSAPVT